MFCLILCRLSSEGQEFFTSYDEVHDSFDAMGLQENLLRGIYAYGRCRWYRMLFAFLFDARLHPCIVVIIYISGPELHCSYSSFLAFEFLVLQLAHIYSKCSFSYSCKCILLLYFVGFEKPSAIQQRGIVPFCKGLDVIQQAQSGTGKTATFCSGILQQLDYGLVQCQALVLAPTRELAQQIEKVMRALGDYLGVKVHACVGGTSVREDQRILQAGVHVVVGTPGRVFDMLRRQSLRADYIKMFVLDEADEMLSRGFKDQVSYLFSVHFLR